MPTAVAQEQEPQNVQISSRYGNGYFVIPGTSTSLRISGRLETGIAYNSASSTPTTYTLEGRLGFESRGDTALGPLETRSILRWTPNASGSAGTTFVVLNSGSSTPTFPYIRLGHVWVGTRAPSNLNFGGGFAPSNEGFIYERGTASGSDNAAGTLPQAQFGNTTLSGAQSRLFRLGESHFYLAGSIESESPFTATTITPAFFNSAAPDPVPAPNITLAIGANPSDGALRQAQIGVIASPHHSGWGVLAGGDWDLTDDFRLRATGGYLEHLIHYVQSGGALNGASGFFATIGNDWDIHDDLRHRGTISHLAPNTADDRWLISSQLDWTGVPDLAVLFRSTYNTSANAAQRYRFLLNATYTGFSDGTRTIGNSDFIGSQDFSGTAFSTSGVRLLLETTTDFNEGFDYESHTTIAQASVGRELTEDVVLIGVVQAEFEASPSFGDFAHQETLLGVFLFWNIVDDLEFAARGRVFFDDRLAYDTSDVRLGLHYSYYFLPNQRWRSDLTADFNPRLNWDQIEWRNRLDIGTLLNTSFAVDQRIIWNHYVDPTEYRLSATAIHQF